jgi:hypothetical protein
VKKQKAKKAGGKKDDKPESPSEAPKPEEEKAAAEPEPEPEPTPEHPNEEEPKLLEGSEPKDTESVPELNRPSHGRQPSLSVQSKMRSSSFRASGGPLSPGYPGFSPEGDTGPDIYRKQAIKIEELEKENKRLAKEAADGEKRWKKAEEELEDLREAEGESAEGKNTAYGAASQELEKLVSSSLKIMQLCADSGVQRTENAALLRQIGHLQSRTSRHGSSPSVSTTVPAELEAALQSKNSTIESMQIEISNLKAQLDRVASGSSIEKEQIAALEDKLGRSERSAALAQRELGDLKKNLERITEKAVKEGSERTSAETKLRTLEREAEEAKNNSKELQKKVDALEKKVAALGTLHKEHDARFQAQKKEREKAEKESADLRVKLAGIENENLRLREERERTNKRDAQGIDDEGVDELENEERQRLEKKVRELEGEVYELRRGVWRERRKELDGEESSSVTIPGARFTDIDLGGGMSPNRRRSIAHGGKGLSDFFTSGFNAITGAASGHDDVLLEDEGDLDFDEDAYRLAQEEEARKRIERIKEVKRALKNWHGWRLDLVENRKGGGNPIFEV